MRSVVVLSGKGGVGKTSISSALALTLSKSFKLVVADCDVDTPNLGLMFQLKGLKSVKPFFTERAVLDESKCLGCGKCVSACAFNALSMNALPVIDRFACDGCGSCVNACPTKALSIKQFKSGFLGVGLTRYGFNVVSASLKPGSHGSGKVVSEVKDYAANLKGDLLLIDSAAGTGCPVIASVNGADFAVIVTEPTPAATSDLRRAIVLLNHFNTSFITIINKADLNPAGVKVIKQLTGKAFTIPYSESFIKAVTNLEPELILNDEQAGPVIKSVAELIKSKL